MPKNTAVTPDEYLDDLEALRDDDPAYDAYKELERAQFRDLKKKSAHVAVAQVLMAVAEILDPVSAADDNGKCPEHGCVSERDGKWRVTSNKTGKLWPQHYDTKADAEAALAAFHIPAAQRR